MFYKGLTELTTSPPTVSPHYLINLKPHKQCILKSVVTVGLCHYSTEE